MHASETQRTVSPAKNLNGSLRLPGDKSISHRYALLAGLAQGTSRFSNFSTGADPASSLSCVEALGAKVVKDGQGNVEVTGTGGVFHAPSQPLDCGNSGSTMRMLAGLLAGQKGEFTLVGDESLTLRPMERVRKPLEQMGATLKLTEGHAPMIVCGGDLQAIDYTTPVPSAQVKSAVLFAGLGAQGQTRVHESIRTRDHSELALRAFGVELECTPSSVTLAGGQTLQAIEAEVPGDLSSAAFFLCAAAIFPESNLILDSVGLNPTRASLLDVLVELGSDLSVLKVEDKAAELIGTLQLRGPQNGLQGATIAGGLAAQLIDELPVLAAIGPYTRYGIRIRDAKELRVKESDRIALVAKNLRAMGAEFEEFEDGLDIPGGQTLHGGEIDAGGDHRIAMAFSVAALRAKGESIIHGADSAAISFPEFYTYLDQLAQR